MTEEGSLNKKEMIVEESMKFQEKIILKWVKTGTNRINYMSNVLTKSHFC